MLEHGRAGNRQLPFRGRELTQGHSRSKSLTVWCNNIVGCAVVGMLLNVEVDLVLHHAVSNEST